MKVASSAVDESSATPDAPGVRGTTITIEMITWAANATAIRENASGTLSP